jgi:hypothetical protein
MKVYQPPALGTSKGKLNQQYRHSVFVQLEKPKDVYFSGRKQSFPRFVVELWKDNLKSMKKWDWKIWTFQCVSPIVMLLMGLGAISIFPPAVLPIALFVGMMAVYALMRKVAEMTDLTAPLRKGEQAVPPESSGK